jgi:CMP-N-acetylneuraminic acid synthetase
MNFVLITARGGSKGLPRKNILSLNGLPVIAWTIRAAKEVAIVDRVYVSTEDEEIAQISREYGAIVINRPNSLSTDSASSESVIAHSIKAVDQGMSASWILLQPTSPLRTKDHIEEAILLHKKKNANCTISVFEPKHTPIKSYIENNDGSISGLYSNEAPYTRRQDLPRAFQPNGAIYIFSSKSFCENHQIPRQGVCAYIMPESVSVDLDSEEDFTTIVQIMKEKNYESNI